jgi:PleD family two-component response regulator
VPDLARILQEAVGVAETIRLASAQPVESNGAAIHTTLSIVGVVLAEPGVTIDALIARAHQAMVRSKQGGRNQVIPVEGPSSVVDLTGRSNSRS